MKWAEVIMLRSGGSRRKLRDAILKDMMNEVFIESEHQSIRVFHHEQLPSDICIVLFHSSTTVRTEGSILGLHLVSALKEVGLVNHTVWNEINQTK